MLSRIPRFDRYPAWARHVVALATMGVALALRIALDPALGATLPFVTLFGGVALAVWFSGWPAAVVAAIAGYLAAEYWLGVPRGAFSHDGALLLGSAFAYTISAGLIIALGAVARRSLRQAEQDGARLEREVAERSHVQAQLTVARDELRIDLADMQRLHELSARLLGEESLETMLQGVLEAAVALMGADKGNVQLYDPETKTLKIVGQVGFDEAFMIQFGLVPLDYSVCGKALAQGERIVVEDAARDPRFAELAADFARHGFVAVQSTPLRASSGEIFGMISTHFARPHRPAERTLRLMDLYAHYAEQVVERGRIEAALRSRSEELQAMLDSMPAFVCIALDASCNVIIANHTMTEALGLPPECNISQAGGAASSVPLRYVDADDQPMDRDELPMRRAAATGLQVKNAEFGLAVEGRRLWLSGNATPLFAADGAVRGVIAAFIDVSERRQAETALQQAHELLGDRAKHLESLVEARTAKLIETVGELEAFSYSLSHDLRAPLRAMHGFSQLLREECGPLTPAALDYLQRITRSAERMDRLIVDVLNYNRVVASGPELTRVDVQALLRGIVESYPGLQALGDRLQIEGEIPPVRGNEAVLTQCFSNLLTNAVKFVAPEVPPVVRVWAERRGERVRVFVGDNGIGIPPTAHERIFRLFERMSKNYEGTGVGLAIVKKSAERLGGSVGLESAPGAGSTFWVELAAAREEEA
ncbi:GAF domain-containing protein [Horticoccus luteus]|uniref:histidine kinase n=1 Tax=Horticoccus luteus TaxID=2862869 RepID=A0A8F9XGG8_9BACT|nr:ATP-binding protein [Horticoccus luteus]QYM79192.1 GAF domain-containing protein [Horticoccus luteus]